MHERVLVYAWTDACTCMDGCVMYMHGWVIGRIIMGK